MFNGFRDNVSAMQGSRLRMKAIKLLFLFYLNQNRTVILIEPLTNWIIVLVEELSRLNAVH